MDNATKQFLDQCKESVLKGDKQRAESLASETAAGAHDILDVIENGFSAGIRRAGELWEEGEYFLPELAFSAEAMKAAMSILQPSLIEKNEKGRSKGTVVIGTVQGDIHDIGKTLVGTMLASNGFRVLDLGADVQLTRFIEEAKNNSPCFVCMSALLTTTMVGQREVIELLSKGNLKDKTKVVVGGAPTTAEWAREIGADGHAENAVDAVRVVNSLLP